MRRPLAIVGTGVLALALLGCGKSEAERQAEEATRAAEEAAKGLEEMARGFEALAGGGDPGPAAADPVSFRELQVLFPDLDGWQKGTPTGEQMNVPMRFSQATVTYTRGDATIDATIVDSAMNQLVLAPYSAFLMTGFERDTGSGHEKSVTVAGHPGWERWDREALDGELNALVNKRFLVQFEGNGISDTKVLHQLAERTDFRKLASLK
jgi:hypothetical protein